MARNRRRVWFAYFRAPLETCRMNGRFRFHAPHHDRLQLLHVVEIVRRDGVLALHGLLEHLRGRYQTDVLV